GVFGRMGGAFAEDSEGAGVVDGLAVGAQPVAYLEQDGLCLLRNGAVGFGADVEQEIAVFANGIDELLNERGGGAVLVVVDVAPGVNGDRGIGLPREQAQRID